MSVHSEGRGPRAIVVTVGDELLYGETIDTNAAWLGRALAGAGILLARRLTVGDDPAAIKRAVIGSLDESEIVIFTGGLGPTRDDLTRGAVASAVGRPLREDARLLTELEARFRGFGYDRLPPTNHSQAQVPEGAEVLPNPLGTAPGLLLEIEGRFVALLPGVPREMRAIFERELEPRLRDRFAHRLGVVRHRVLHTTGIAESSLAEKVEAALSEIPASVSLAYLPDVRGVDLRLTVRLEADSASADEHLAGAAQVLKNILRPWIFEAKSGDLVEALLGRLRAYEASLAVAESCTGGLLAHRIVSVPGVSDIFLGGAVAYSNEMKTRLLGVPADLIERVGAVSEPVARAMACGAAERFGADATIAITGVAGPGGGTAEKPVGTVWVAMVFRGEVRATQRRFPGDREDIQARAAQEGLRLLWASLAPDARSP